MWEHCNDIKHNTTTPQQLAALQQLRTQVEEEFVKGLLGLPESDHYLLDDKDLILSYDLAHTKWWLALLKGARQAQIRTEAVLQNQFKAAQKFMRDWLATANPCRSHPIFHTAV